MTIELHAWPTPNGYKISIALEELGLPYRAIPVDIGRGDQFKPDFLKLSPNNRMPAIVDPDGPGGAPISLFESGAILIYLAEKTGRLLPSDPQGRYQAIQWLMWQMGGFGPMLGQAHHFRLYAPERIPYAVDRYTNEAGRLYRVLDKRLGEAEFLAGEYSIADIAVFPWSRGAERQGVDLAELPNVRRWFEAIDARPAVRKGLELLKEHVRTGPLDDKARDVMFGKSQFERR
ncbi:glutathione S-transferase N-terminal domain-containing protein [Arenibaculum pallidiluteum]|uniref:glutathione S-transferase N-terminal domain-containing protein n=1 Tax=Arenibaculum pallidiluteum TaxID=2812559 RepID=UPI001A97C338|nr:glutathione S-transferase N-terminal domain-containing protein [Arenibaculum pallidiluteum]